MSCKKYQRLLSARLDGELSLREISRLEDHLAQCPDCRGLAEKMRRGIELYQALDQAETASELSPFLPERIAARAVEKSFRLRPLVARLGVGLGALALVLGLVGYLFKAYPPGRIKSSGINLSAIRYQSRGIGVEIEGDRFVLHSKDKNGKRGVDVKF